MGADTENIYDEAFIQNIIKKLNYYTKFYDEGHPKISDKEWDDMYFELVKAENETGIYFEDSPTQRVNYQVLNKLEKVEHDHLMLSLDKTKDINTLNAFIKNKDIISMAKMDGLTCSLTYENGRLIKAETRGNGIVGENILHNALQVKNIPNKINFKKKLVIDGEIICDYKTFERFNSEYKNPRNFASGSIRLLDSRESSMRGLSFVAWDCIEGLENEIYLNAKLWSLHENGFTIVPYIVHGNNNIEKDIENIKKYSKEKGYPIDGIVVKYNNVEEYLKAGKTDHHFKGGLAYKFYDDEYDTILRDITYDIGRTGVLTPVAIFDPVDIDGTECSRASLHNISVMKNTLHGFGWKGQRIKVAKMNMIIPQIISAENDNEYTKEYINYPYICPICKEKTSIHNNNRVEILMCDNPDCKGKILNRLVLFCSKKGLDIKGLSKATLEKLMNWGWLNTYLDIFLLHSYKDEWIKKPGFGEASVNKILNAIEESKKTSLERVIAAAGIPEIGSRVAKDLASHYNSWSDFRSEKDFSQYEGIGEVMNNNLLTFDYDDLQLDYTIKTYLHNTEKCSNQEQYINNKLNGEIFCITGSLYTVKNRKALSDIIEKNGGKVVSSVSTKTNYLINNDLNSTSSKNLQAKKLNIPIISELEFLKRIEE